MPLQEQAELWMALRDRMKGSWKELTVQEKKAGGFNSPFNDPTLFHQPHTQPPDASNWILPIGLGVDQGIVDKPLHRN